MKNSNDYSCEIHGSNGKIGDIKLSGYSAEFVYKPPNLDNLTPRQKEKLEFLTKILNEKA